PAGVEVSVDANNVVTVKGPKGVLTQEVNKVIAVKIDKTECHFTRNDEEKQTKAMHGLYRKLVFNMVEGVTKGYAKSLIVNGVGFKVAKQGKKVVMNIGYSHPVEFAETDGITLECPSITEIVVKGIDKDAVGQMAANIRKARICDPYHAYGIRYSDEVVVRKEGKKAGK
ncbi:MAG: 50S ribosomal protein L6, partial [Clostridia bacterium]